MHDADAFAYATAMKGKLGYSRSAPIYTRRHFTHSPGRADAEPTSITGTAIA